MGRKTWAAGSAEKLNQATAEAARILSGDLAALSATMQAYLRASGQAKDAYARAELFNQAMELVNAAAKLGETIGKVKGEMRQHISVERYPDRTEIAPKSAFNSDALSTPIPAKTAGNRAAYPLQTGGGGDGANAKPKSAL